MSALAHFVDSSQTSPEVRERRRRHIRCSKYSALFDHLVGLDQDRRRNGQSKVPGDFEIYAELELLGLSDRQVPRRGPFPDFVDVPARATEQIGETSSIGQE